MDWELAMHSRFGGIRNLRNVIERVFHQTAYEQAAHQQTGFAAEKSLDIKDRQLLVRNFKSADIGDFHSRLGLYLTFSRSTVLGNQMLVLRHWARRDYVD